MKAKKSKAEVTKNQGVTYTPEELARFMARRLVEIWLKRREGTPTAVRVLDPAVGEGALLCAVYDELVQKFDGHIELVGADIDADALEMARERCAYVMDARRSVLTLVEGDFLEMTHEQLGSVDLVIANPPYVRTQNMGAASYQKIAAQFGLKGRADLSLAFLLNTLSLKNSMGCVVVVVPNSLLLTTAAKGVRMQILDAARLEEIWDLGDTRLFDAAVLPVVLGLSGSGEDGGEQLLSDVSVYSAYTARLPDGVEPVRMGVIDALEGWGEIQGEEIVFCQESEESKVFGLRAGYLGITPHDLGWVLRSPSYEELLRVTRQDKWCHLSELGSIKVGVKSCADKVFLRDDWHRFDVEPEMLREVMTHRNARAFCAKNGEGYQLLYPHYRKSSGKRGVYTLEDYPGLGKYVRKNRKVLKKRRYLEKVGRLWYELWVPQDPDGWEGDKVIWRDIATRPEMWLDRDGAVVNGDCYWFKMSEDVACESWGEDVLWLLLALGNSDFAVHFYEAIAGHQIYSGRRRYMARYLELFPLPDMALLQSQELIDLAKLLYESPEKYEELKPKLDALAWDVWGLDGDAFREFSYFTL